MTIHLIECDERPKDGSVVKANCGEEIIFKSPIAVEFNNENLCEECLLIHRTGVYREKTFAHTKEIK